MFFRGTWEISHILVGRAGLPVRRVENPTSVIKRMAQPWEICTAERGVSKGLKRRWCQVLWYELDYNHTCDMVSHPKDCRV